MGFFKRSLTPPFTYANATEARRKVKAYFRFYNDQRPHQALGYRTPAEVFHETMNSPAVVSGSVGLGRVGESLKKASIEWMIRAIMHSPLRRTVVRMCLVIRGAPCP